MRLIIALSGLPSSEHRRPPHRRHATSRLWRLSRVRRGLAVGHVRKTGAVYSCKPRSRKTQWPFGPHGHGRMPQFKYSCTRSNAPIYYARASVYSCVHVWHTRNSVAHRAWPRIRARTHIVTTLSLSLGLACTHIWVVGPIPVGRGCERGHVTIRSL